MLAKIREKTQGIIATFILLLIVIPFALWGINSYFDAGPGVSVAKVDGQEINQPAYRAALERFRGRIDPAMMDSPAFKQMVLSSLIEQTLLTRDAEDSGYRIGDARLGQMIRDVPLFQRDGRFDPLQYEALLRREGLTARDFELRLRAENLTRQVQAGITDSVIVTDTEVNSLARLLAQERVVAVAVVGPESYARTAKVGPEEIEKYYEANADQFKTPDQVRVQYLELKAGVADAKYQPDEAELKRAYEEEAARYVTPEKRRLSHILITLPDSAPESEVAKALARIQDIERKARAGGDFAQLAKQHSQDTDSAKKGGDLGELRAGLLPKPLEQAARALKLREVSKPIRSEYGYHLLKLTAHTPEKRKTLAEVKPELTKMLRQRRAEERFVELAEKFRNLVYENSDSLQVAANTLELNIQTSDWFTRSGGSGVAKNLKVVEAAFSPEVLSKTRNSDAIEVNDQTLVAVRVIDHRPAARRPLHEVRAQIERTLRQQAALRQAAETAGALLKELNAGAALDKLAATRGLKYEADRKVTREQVAGLDRRIVEAAFRAARPSSGKSPVYGVADLGSQGQALFALKQVVETPVEKLDAAIKDRARRQLVERRGQGLYTAYRTGLRQKAEVTIVNERL
jgi:peptidyl-prolyl cis-trans isomerase D